MNGTADLARRNGASPASPAVPGAALALSSGQTMWNDKQRAALVAMGVSDKATNAELAVFLHQCQRTGLDPFSRQIYLIHRREKQGDHWVSKPTTQVGIDGYRVIRDRIAERKGLAVEYEPTIWWDAEGGRHEAWLWDEPPAACTVAVRVDGRRFSSTLRFKEYAQVKNRETGELTAMWRDKSAHMIEKCAEADVLRRVFPNDMSGVLLSDEMPPEDPAAAQDRPRVTAEQARARAGQRVTAEVVASAPAEAPEEEPAEQPAPRRASKGQVGLIRSAFTRIYPGEETPAERLQRLAETTALAGREDLIGSTGDLTADEAARVIRALDRCKDAGALKGLLETGENGE